MQADGSPHLDSPVGIQQEVGALEIPVDDGRALAVEVEHALGGIHGLHTHSQRSDTCNCAGIRCLRLFMSSSYVLKGGKPSPFGPLVTSESKLH